MVFNSSTSGKDIADLYTMQFTGDGVEPTPAPTDTPAPTAKADNSTGSTQAPAASASPAPTGQATAAPTQDTGISGETGDNTGDSIFVKKNISYAIPKGTEQSKTVYVDKVSSKKSSVTIPATVKNGGVKYKVIGINKAAFSNLKKLKKVTIGANVSEIKDGAFVKCPKLKSIIIKSKKLKKASNKAFIGINKKCTIKVPKGKTAKYKKMFPGKVK